MALIACYPIYQTGYCRNAVPNINPLAVPRCKVPSLLTQTSRAFWYGFILRKMKNFENGGSGAISIMS